MNFICLIYQMGKVGSSTLYETLVHHYGKEKIIKLHFLSESFKARAIHEEKYQWHLNQIKVVEDICRKYPDDRIKIISMAREPVSRSISNLFQNPNNYLKNGKSINDLKIQDLISLFKRTNSFKFTLNWFEKEFLEFTGIDIYRHRFNKNRGYSIINESKFDVLLMRTEDINVCIAQALKEFLHLDLKKIVSSNQSKNKDTSHFHEKFLELISFDPIELDEVYSSKYAQHFYTDQEIINFKKKWSD